MGHIPYTSSNSIILITITVYLIIISFCLISYLFMAFGLYEISKNRGYNKPWLAFIPLANYYLLGAVADNINMSSNKRTHFRIILTISTGATWVFNIIVRIATSIIDGFYNLEPVKAISVGLLLILVSLIMLSISVTSLVFLFIALYKIYKDYSPDNAVLFIVLSIIFIIPVPFFIFAIRKNSSVSIYYAQQPQQYQQYYYIQ